MTLRHYLHFLQHPMDLQGLARGQRSLTNGKTSVAGEGSAAAEAIMTIAGENPKIDQRRNTPYPTARRGY
jgi:hypothetical protein